MMDNPDPAPRLTPMYQQYLGIKEEYPDALLFYRMGDFYELFFEDARTAARELQLALTSRNKGAGNPIPMCGVPWQAVEGYIAQLVEKGYSVAICDQMEDQAEARGMVRRAVTRVITPGTIVEDSGLASKENNFLAAICPGPQCWALAWLDISTGKWSGLESRKEGEIWQWTQKMRPAEIIVPDNCSIPRDALPAGAFLSRQRPALFDLKRARERVFRAQCVRDSAAIGLDQRETLLRACGALVGYLDQTQKRDPDYLLPFRPLDLGRRLVLDEITERNLEIFCTLSGRKGRGTLRHVLDHTLTPMGGRLLEDMLRNPWRELAPILRIQGAVELLHANDDLREKLGRQLAEIYDLERISSRISLGRASPRDFISLRQGLERLPALQRLLEESEAGQSRLLADLLAGWDSLEDCAALLASALRDNPPLMITDGGLIRQGFNAELDRLVNLVENSEAALRQQLEEEQKSAGLPRLKLGSNRVFGYYYEISRGALPAKLPEHFSRRQSLANCERFTTPGLKKLEEEILSASGRRNRLEFQIFTELREHVASFRERIAHMADRVAQLDYCRSLAEVGRKNAWCLPSLDDSVNLDISEGRHPVVEDMLGATAFVPNSFSLDATRRLCLLTGPNMSGKSTVLRQVAIIVLLAQMGSMVPARSARIGLADRIFSRVGASDDLARGQSTFMMEMMETARILRQATRRSLIILDEIGRGTSTWDGVAIAWAVVENLAERAGGSLRTLFATHYHELVALEEQLPGVFTMNIAIQEHNRSIIFLHRLLPGPADKSYGIEVARLAGVPLPVVQRANEILARLETGEKGAARAASPLTLPGLAGPKASPDLSALLQGLDLASLSPEQALRLLTQWQRRFCGEGGAHRPARGKADSG